MYGGTQAEMARLINDSGVLGDKMKVTAKTVNEVSFDKMIEAIHVVQTEMGISGISAEEAAELVASGAMTEEEAFALMGTTAKEAATTIEGSTKAMSAAWDNLLVGIADDDQDFDKLVDRFVKSAETAVSNILPRIETILSNLGKLFANMSPIISSALPKLVESTIPALLVSGVQLMQGIIQGLVSALPDLIIAGEHVIKMLGDGIVENVPSLVANLPVIIQGIVDFLSDNMPVFLEQGIQILQGIAMGVISAIPEFVENLPALIDAIAQFLEENAEIILEQGANLVLNIAEGLVDAIPKLIEALPKIIESIVNFISDSLPEIVNQGILIVVSLITGIIEQIPELVATLPQIIDAIVNGLSDLIGGIVEAGENIVRGLWEGIKNMTRWISEKVKGFGSGILKSIKDFFGIHSPSRVFRDEVGYMLGLGVAEGLENSTSKAVKAANSLGKSVYKKSKDWVDTQAKYFGMSLKDQLEVWETIQSQFIKSSRQYADAEKEILDIRKKAQDEYYDKVSEIGKKISGLEESYADELKDRQNEIFNSYGLFDKVAERENVSGDKLVRNLKEQVNTITEYYGKLDKLSERGVSVGIVEQLRDMGPDAISELDALLSLTDKKLSEYSALYEEKQKLANEIALKQLEPLREETDDEIKTLIDDLDALTTENAPIIGESLADGIRDGILSQEKAVVSAVDGVMQRIEQRAMTAAANIQAAISAVLGRVPQLDATVSSMTPQSVSVPRFGTENALTSAAGMMAMAQSTGYSREIVLNVNGREFARGIIPDIRTVDKQTPEIQFA